MLQALYSSLREDSLASVNFRNFSNSFNQPFYQYYLDQNGKLIEDGIEIAKGEKQKNIPVKVLDYRECQDLTIRNLDRQTYLTSLDDMETVIGFAGFEIDDHASFHFSSPANPDNEIDVFRIRKSASVI